MTDTRLFTHWQFIGLCRVGGTWHNPLDDFNNGWSLFWKCTLLNLVCYIAQKLSVGHLFLHLNLPLLAAFHVLKLSGATWITPMQYINFGLDGL